METHKDGKRFRILITKVQVYLIEVAIRVLNLNPLSCFCMVHGFKKYNMFPDDTQICDDIARIFK